jgi:phosphatidylserine decarboxylase
MRIVSDSYRFLIPLGVVVLVLLLLNWYVAAVLTGIIFLFVLSFFRDPERDIPEGDDLIVSPADGKVVRVRALEGEYPFQVSIFLSVFNVHVNRSPVKGEVRELRYQKGIFRAAFYEAASVENEQSIVVIENQRYRVKVALIAGLIARRIVSWIELGQHLERGERIGLIRFGSRVDLFLPPGVELKVQPGSRVKGGATVIARFTSV